MAKKTNAYEDSICLLKQLKTKYPNRTLGQHISTALDEYGNIWNLSDNEFLYALNKYRATLECDTVAEEDIDKIIRDAQNLDTLFMEEDENYD